MNTNTGHAIQEPDAAVIAPFWQRLNRFFLFPFQTGPLIYALLLALAGYLLYLPFISIFVRLGILLGASYYAFKVAALASRGVLHSRDYTASVEDPDWKVLPWKFFAVLVVHGLAIGFLGSRSIMLMLLAMLLSSLLIPATLMVLIQSFSLRAALNPLELLSTMTGIGWQYLLLWLFLFLLQAGSPEVLALLIPVMPGWLLPPLFVFTAVYFMWVMAAMIGYVMYQHHGALQIDLLRQPVAEGAPPVDPAKAQARQRDAEVSALVRDGRLREAIDQAREWARTGTDALTDEGRYHRVLLFDDPASGRLASHAQRYVPLLLEQKRGREALQVHQTVTEKLPGFALEQAGHTLALAEQAWNRHDARQTIALLRGFDKRYTGAPEIPRAYELVIRALKQGLGLGSNAMPVYQTLARRYPEHQAAKEAAWVLRDELAAQP